MRFTKILLALLVALAASVVIGCGDKPTTPINSAPPSIPASTDAGTVPATPPTPKVDSLLKAKPDVTLTPKAFSDELLKDVFAFGRKYHGKIVDVTGLVTMYSYSTKEGLGFLFLTDEGVKYGCVERHPMSKATPGQTVTLRCRWSDDLPRHPWEIVRVEGASPSVLAAEQLATTIKAGKDKAWEKLDDKYIILTGSILKLEMKPHSKIYLTMPGLKPEITGFLDPEAKEVADNYGWLKTGQPVADVLGKWQSGSTQLLNCVVLPPVK